MRGATKQGAILIGDAAFQPTRPLRGATMKRNSAKVNIRDFNPRAPCGARLSHIHEVSAGIDFNPRAPCGARLISPLSSTGYCIGFQPTRPLRGATAQPVSRSIRLFISTHAPLAGRDSKSVQITMHIFAITDKFQMLLHRMPPVRAFCSFLMQENHADLGANRPSDLCALVLRTIRSSVPRADTSACSRSVRFYSRTSCPSSKIEGCPFLGQ